MRCSLLVAASVAPLLLATATVASAQPHFGGGGFRGGGFHGGGFHGGFHGRGIGMRPYGLRPAFPGYRPGWGGGWRGGWHGAGFYPRRPWGGYYPYRRYWGGYYPYWGAAAGLATAAAIGAAASYPAYDYYPAYPVYPAYDVVPAASGGQCSTPVKICTLYAPAPLGTGCSCRVPGGRARGAVVGP